MTPERTVVVEGLVNARDLGGLPVAGGGRTPTGVLLRSERPTLVPPAGWRELQRRGVRTVLDLRLPAELRDAPVVPPEGIAARHVDLDGLEHEGFWAPWWDSGLVGTPLYSLPHLAALPERTTAVLHEIAAAPPGGLLLHCSGGRDRTGLVAAVLLRIAGVEDDAIVDDYLQTIGNADALAAAQGWPSSEEAVAALLAGRGTTSERAFRDFLAGLDVDALLARLPPAEAAALRTWRGTLP